MVTKRKYMSGVIVAIAFGFAGAGCETTGLDSLPDVGLKKALAGNPAPEPDLKENPPLKMPGANATLPVPGQAVSQVAPSSNQAQKSGT